MKKILLIVLSLLLVSVAALGVWQRENIAALCVALRYRSISEIGEKEKENEEKTKELLSSVTKTQMRDLSKQEREDLENGKISAEEAKELVKNNNKEEKSNADSKAVDDIIARIYVLRSQYTGSLDSLLNQAKAEVMKIPEEKRTTATLLNLGDVFIARGTALEKKCDAQMNALLEELSAQLKKENKSTKIISEIKSVYASEKRLKKAALYNKYYPR